MNIPAGNCGPFGDHDSRTPQTPLLAEEPVHERRLAGVRPADDRDAHFGTGRRVMPVLGVLVATPARPPSAGKPFDDLVEQIVHAGPMFPRGLDERIEATTNDRLLLVEVGHRGRLEDGEKAAEASKEGGFLGFGGVRVSDKEQAFITEVRKILGVAS